ncbi:MAG: DUF899 family protein [Pseudomonadota bacterium]
MPVTVPNESADYRAARTKLLAAEQDLRQLTEDVAELRRQLPPGGEVTKDYAFTATDGNTVPLDSLFQDHDTLMIYSLMYKTGAQSPCPMCSAFLDGLAGQVVHLSKRVSFAVVAENTPQALAALQTQMGWQDLQILSAKGTDYQTDYFAQSPDGNQLPIMNIFVRRDGGVRHFWASEMFFESSPWHPRHLDSMWSLWNILDLTPEGRGTFIPPVKSS